MLILSLMQGYSPKHLNSAIIDRFKIKDLSSLAHIIIRSLYFMHSKLEPDLIII